MVGIAKRSLAETHPELAAQADGWDPKTVTHGSGQILPWRCELNHSYKAKITHRTYMGSGCPYCSGNKVLFGFNDLSTKEPDISKEAHGWDPTQMAAGSSRLSEWKCSEGHIWKTKISHRTGSRSGCPICVGQKPDVGVNDLLTKYPVLASELVDADPRTLMPYSMKVVKWRCQLGHIWKASVASRLTGGCPVCSNHRVLPGFNDLATTHPDIAATAVDWDPTTVTAGTQSKKQWRCQRGHIWTAPVLSRKVGYGCPICSNQQLLVGFNDLASIHPELAAQADGWDPTSCVYGSNKKQKWRCKLDHQWSTSVNQRTQGKGCPICSGQQVQAGFNDLASSHPGLEKEANGWDPTTVATGSGKALSWKCQFGHVWTAVVNSRHLQGETGCPICSGRRVLTGFNDLATTHPELAAQADGWDTTKVYGGSNLRKMWKCDLGHLWKTKVSLRTSGSGCLICLNQQLLVGFNDLATTHPELAAQADGWDPKTVVAGSSKKAKWICEQGHRWSSVLTSRSRMGVGCPSCAKFGFDPNLDGFLYLIDNFDLHMFQIGITNYPDKRLGQHGRSGWEVIELRGPMDGQLTRQLETNCLHALEKRGAILGRRGSIEKFDGHTEAWTKASLNVTSIKQILDWVYEDEGVKNV